MVKVKICGITEVQGLNASVEAGASYVGFVFYSKSSRNVSMSKAAALAKLTPKTVCKVGLLVDPENSFLYKLMVDVPLDMIQLHGQETPERLLEIRQLTRLPIMKAVGLKCRKDLEILKDYKDVCDQFLIDSKPAFRSQTPGGNGTAFDWNILEKFSWSKPWMLAGGLTPINVNSAVSLTGALQVDVSSGVENAQGIKSRDKILSFIRAVRGEENAQ